MSKSHRDSKHQAKSNKPHVEKAEPLESADHPRAENEVPDVEVEFVNLESEAKTAPEENKFHLEFYGSELLRSKVPEAFNLAEAVVDDWQKGGDFRALPLKNPLAQLAAAEGLKRAKKVEKKLEDAGVIPMAKMGFEFLKSKLKK